jgi:hypothetical protein
MPVEIKELVIRAVVSPPQGPAAPAPEAGSGSDGQEAIIQAAVKEVLRILKASKER